MTTILSKQIGQLTQDENFPDWWRSDEVSIQFFDKKPLRIVFMDYEPETDSKFLEEADSALSKFLQFDKVDRLKISDLVFQNYSDFLEATGDDEGYKLKLNKKEDIWDFVHPIEIYVTRRPYNDKDVYVLVHCNCEWEEEHGLQLVFRQGRQLTRVSDIDGHITEADAYDKPDIEDRLLSSFK